MRSNVIPPQDELEAIGYDKAEVEKLVTFGKALNPIKEPLRRGELGRQLLRKLWPDELEFISKAHWIKTKVPGQKVLLEPNYAQKRFYKEVIEHCREEGMPIRGIILKARQLGFSTFIQSWQYEQCDRGSLRGSMTVSYDDESTKELFQKAKMIHDNLWFPRTTDRDSRGQLAFDNGSSFFTRTAGNLNLGRSQTIHHAHCSEVPMWPDAGEALTSLGDAIPLQPGTSIFYESTAKGAYGEFYEDWSDAEAGKSNFVPFFAPWFWDEEYQIAFPDEDRKRAFGRSLGVKDRKYMARHHLTLEQMRWRAAKIADARGNVRRFQQENPADPMEAFLTTGSPCFDPELVSELASNATEPFWSGDIVLKDR